VLPADSTLTGGIGTFSITFKTAGNQTVTATDAGTSTITGSSGTIANSAAAATRFGVSAPATATAGAGFTITVTALDPYGNTATAYAGTVAMSSSDGAAVLPVSTKLTSGVGSFAITLKTAGSQTITATDTVSGAITGTSAAVNTQAAAATHCADQRRGRHASQRRRHGPRCLWQQSHRLRRHRASGLRRSIGDAAGR
jgi:hypothetical protein